MIDFPQKPRDYTTFFLDMNAYFASVEQQVQPPLRNRPVGIAPYTGNTGCIIARSYEAKKWGIGVGDLVKDAKRKCPKIAIIEARPALYQFYHQEILKTLKNHSPNVFPLSIDEFLIRLTGSDCSKERSLNIAQKIKYDIAKVGDYLACSVGIGPNYFLAKVAGESKKPNGLTLITLDNLDNFYAKLSLRDLPGINYRMETLFNKYKIFSPSDLYCKEMDALSKMLGHMGKVWFYRLRGYQIDHFETKNRSCGHSHVLPPESRDIKKAIAVIKKLAEKTGVRLREQNLWASGVAVSIRFLNGGGFSQNKRTTLFNDSATLINEVEHLLKKCNWMTPIYVSVTTFGLVQNCHEPISIFPEIEKSKKISRAIDEINDIYGANTIYPASISCAKSSAPDRIPFGKPRYEIRNF